MLSLRSVGELIPGLYKTRNEGVPIQEIVSAARRLFDIATEEQKQALQYPLDSSEWRSWSNPEFYLSKKGLRLDEVSSDLRGAIHAVLKATLSPEGYKKACGAMKTNHFLGELVNGQAVMNVDSYNLAIFGSVSESEPWGWSFYGHHLCVNAFLIGPQIIVAPFFTGAEPNMIDDGPYKGTRILEVEEKLGLELMQSLPAEVQKIAQIYELMHDPAMPEGRWNKDDQRHLCGAYRDNRIVPYEGVLVSDFSPEQQEKIMGIAEQYLLYLPNKSRQMKLDDVRNMFNQTYFSWIGGYGNEDPFYYRIQSPIIVIEFDHHSGVFLNNEEPAKFHIHTILRYPNAGDYAYALRDQHK